jgi:hypothetical protein
MIAEHVQAAGDVAGAYGWHMRAGTWLSQRDIVAADRSWQRARELADKLPTDEENRTAMRIAPRAMLCANAVRLHAPDSDARFEELGELCEAADDQGSLAFGMAGQIPMLMLRGRVREASQLATEYMNLVESIGDPTLTILLSFVALPVSLETGHIDEVLRWSQAAIDMAQNNPFVEPLVAGALAVRGTARWAEGHSGWRDDLDQAIVMGCGADPMVAGRRAIQRRHRAGLAPLHRCTAHSVEAAGAPNLSEAAVPDETMPPRREFTHGITRAADPTMD